LWFEKAVKKACVGKAEMVRYADDFVCVFEYESEAKKFFAALKERFAKFGLELSEEKSKIIRFGRFAREKGCKDTFDFLGFTFINGTTKKGTYKVILHTSLKKLKVKRAVLKKWLRDNRHMEKQLLVRKLNVKLVGHYRYYGVTGNGVKLVQFMNYARAMLYKALDRRSQKHLTWDKYVRFLQFNPLAIPKIYHSLIMN
jgi:hypothetical protein